MLGSLLRRVPCPAHNQGFHGIAAKCTAPREACRYVSAVGSLRKKAGTMPIISIKIAKGRTLQQKRDLAKAITDSVVSILNVQPEWVTVLIEELERENWSSGGELHIDKLGTGCGKEQSR
jgi:4-oxalocrotonate tautomerase